VFSRDHAFGFHDHGDPNPRYYPGVGLFGDRERDLSFREFFIRCDADAH